MASHVRWGRFFRIAGIAVLALIFCLAAVVPIQQRILRWRAERLLNDIREIQMGKSTWADAQRLMSRWGKWGKWEGSCDAQHCEYQIVLQDASHALASYFSTEEHSEMRSERREYSRLQLLLYSILGGRVAQVYADIRIKNGIIWTKSYMVEIARNPIDEGVYDLLIGDAEGTTRFTPRGDWQMMTKHPEYSIMASGPCEGCSGACTICELIRTDSTPFADRGVISQLFDFNLGCITSWRQCREPKEIMPSAWRIYIQEWKELENSLQQEDAGDWERCDRPVEMLGRDYRFALLTEVASIKTSPDSGLTRYVVRLRGLKSLKNGTNFGSELLEEPLVGWSHTVLPGNIRMAEIKPGSRIVLLFERPLDEWDDVPPGREYCGYVLYTDESRVALQRGFALDALSETP